MSDLPIEVVQLGGKARGYALECDPDVAYIPLTQGHTAFVDLADYPLVALHHWHVQKKDHTCYAKASVRERFGETHHPIMHALLMSTPDGLDTDHGSGNGLDNRRGNLSIVTHRRNCQNLHIEKTSSHPGVHWSTAHRMWIAKARIGRTAVWSGRYESECAAAAAYLAACGRIESGELVCPSRAKNTRRRRTFTESEVDAMRTLRTSGVFLRDIATRFQTSPSSVYYVVSGLTHAPAPTSPAAVFKTLAAASNETKQVAS